MHLEIVVQGKCVVSHKPGVLIGWSSMQNLHCLCCVTGFEAARDPWGSPALASGQGCPHAIPEPRLVLPGAEPILLRGNDPLSSRNR